MTGRMHRIPELLEFYSLNELKACFFFGMDNALRLSYHYKKPKRLIHQILEDGHEAGVHGIETKNKAKIMEEKKRFEEVSGLSNFGIRTHYLRLSGYTHQLFTEAGYNFNSTIEVISKPVRIGKIWEIPISLMDASLVPLSQLNQNFDSWKKNTLIKIESALECNIPVFVINFHDIYFNAKEFPVIKQWYQWLIEYLIEGGYNFTTFNTYLNTLNKEN